MIRIAISVDGLRDGAPPYTLRSSFSSSVARRGALVRQVVSRLNAGLCCARGGFAQKEEEEARFRGLPLALASELCVWNGFCRGELGLLLVRRRHHAEEEALERIRIELIIAVRV